GPITAVSAPLMTSTETPRRACTAVSFAPYRRVSSWADTTGARGADATAAPAVSVPALTALPPSTVRSAGSSWIRRVFIAALPFVWGGSEPRSASGTEKGRNPASYGAGFWCLVAPGASGAEVEQHREH